MRQSVKGSVARDPKPPRLCQRVRAIWDDDKSSRRQDLLAGAARLFAVKEFSEIGIQDVCKEAALAKGTFYLYFSSKEEAFLALAETKLRAWADAALVALAAVPAGSDVSAVASAFAASFRGHDDLLRLLSMLHSIIERNVPPAKIVPFKTALGAVQREQTPAWLRLVPGISEAEVAELMLFVSSAIVGVWTVVRPPESAKAAMTLAGLDVTPKSFEVTLARQLEVFLRGLAH